MSEKEKYTVFPKLDVEGVTAEEAYTAIRKLKAAAMRLANKDVVYLCNALHSYGDEMDDCAEDLEWRIEQVLKGQPGTSGAKLYNFMLANGQIEGSVGDGKHSHIPHEQMRPYRLKWVEDIIATLEKVK